MSDPSPHAQTIPFLVRDPDYYRHVARTSEDIELLRACLLLASDDIDRWRDHHREP